MFVDVELDPLISITSHVSGCKKGPLFLRQLCLWLELKVDLELHKPVVDLVSFAVEQVWLDNANLSIWNLGLVAPEVLILESLQCVAVCTVPS